MFLEVPELTQFQHNLSFHLTFIRSEQKRNIFVALIIYIYVIGRAKPN